MPSRKFHGKTRSGCAQCKARHVKCGEERPVCGNCARRQTTCVYPEFVAALPRPLSRGSLLQSTTAAPCNDASAKFDGLDLTLMHHYAVSTSLLLQPIQSAQKVWQVEVPAKARDNTLLHHGMLALAGMHLASEAAQNRDHTAMKRYRSRGLHHQQSALPIFRSLLDHEQLADSQVIFIFSLVLVVLAFASALSAETRPTLDEILDLFALFRGPRALWRDHAGGVNSPWIDSLFGPSTPYLRHDLPGEGVHFVELDKLAVDPACQDALTSLKFSIRCFWMQPMSIKAAMWFPAMDSEGYMLQVRARQPAALGIIKAYASILEAFNAVWWLSGWSRILEDAVDDAVAKSSSPISLPDVGNLLACGRNGCRHAAPLNAALQHALTPPQTELRDGE